MSPMEKSTVFSRRLREMRTSKGFTSKHMATLLGVAPSSYSQYENGKREPDVIKIIEISNILNISGDYLLGLTDDPTKIKNVTNFHPLQSADKEENTLLAYFRDLNSIGKDKLLDYAADLIENNKYKE